MALATLTEVVYIGNWDNTNDFRLESDGVALDLSSATRIDAKINDILDSSLNQSGDAIRWDQAGFETGEIRCRFGSIPGLMEGNGHCYFIVYDPTNPNGVVFGPITLGLVVI